MSLLEKLSYLVEIPSYIQDVLVWAGRPVRGSLGYRIRLLKINICHSLHFQQFSNPSELASIRSADILHSANLSGGSERHLGGGASRMFETDESLLHLKFSQNFPFLVAGGTPQIFSLFLLSRPKID